MPRNTSRGFLNSLWKEIVVDRKIGISQETELNDNELASKGVYCRPLEIEAIEHPKNRRKLNPPFFFEPLSPQVLLDHPVPESSLTCFEFVEYGDSPPGFSEWSIWTICDGVHTACTYVSSWTSAVRPNIPSNFGTLTSFSRFEYISMPDPLLLTPGMGGLLPGHFHRTQHDMFEAEGKQLNIHRSRLYSFETLADAPVELFARFLASKPQGLERHVLR